MITKPKIGGFGLNLQHCAHTTVFPSHSFEQYYQCIRRFYRFGQTKDVVVDIVTTPGMDDVLKNMQRKAAQAEIMFSELINAMNNALNIKTDHSFNHKEKVPSWL